MENNKDLTPFEDLDLLSESEFKVDKLKSSQSNDLDQMVAKFQPSDAIESSLCYQIVVCQEKAFELMRSEGRSPEWFKLYSNSASKLLARSQSAMQQLTSYRREKTQKVVVERVNMESGSQAAFGHFETHQGFTSKN